MKRPEPETPTEEVLELVYEQLTADDDGRVCKDIPEQACVEQPSNFLTHVVSLAATKTGDGLADPKLTLAWLVTALGGSPLIVGLLVPVREAGALLPQLFTAGAIRSMPRRKLAWAAGSLVQGLSVLGMALSAFFLDGSTAGWAILGLLGVFALARSVCSVSYKDVLGKTVSKSTRGTATGTAATVAASAVLLFGVLLSFGVVPLTISSIAVVLCVAAGLWMASAGLFVTLAEDEGATEGGGNPVRVALNQIGLLKEDPQLVRFILVRGLLVSTALAPPYLLGLSASAERSGLGDLGPFVIASSLAAICSSYVWGRLSDRSSRAVLTRSGLIGAGVLAGAGVLGVFGAGVAVNSWVMPLLLFALMIGYQGVRQGRSTYLVDMATEDTRLAYTAISNTTIGLLLVLASGFAALAQAAGYPAVLFAFAVMAALAAGLSRGLKDVSG